MCGGASAVKIPDAEEAQFFVECKAMVEAAASATYETFVPVHFTSQVVAGTNFQIKYNVGGDDHVHAKIFRPLPHTGAPAEVKSFNAGHNATAEFNWD